MRRFTLPIATLLLAAPLAAQVPPDAEWRTLETPRFRVTFGPGLAPLARHAAASAEAAYDRVAALIAQPPAGRIDILLADHVDLTNGFAQPFPSNRITLYARPPVDDAALADYGDWMDLVITHELAHIFHLDRAGGLGRALRSVFGRVPLTWPLFPALGTPRWNIEGLGVLAETALTGAGRNHGTFHDMVLRTAALDGALDRMDRLNASSPIWPGDQRVYIYGARFMEYLAERYGPDVHRRLVAATASAVLPPTFFFDRVAKRTIGASFDEAYADWRAQVVARAEARADTLRAEGLTDAERLTGHGQYALFPRLSPDGRALAYIARDGRVTTSTRVIDPATGDIRWQNDRNGVGGLAWLPDGSGLVTAELEYGDAYHVWQDVYVVDDDGSRRITRSARVQDPDVAADGARIVAVQNGGGTNRLVVVRRSDGRVEPLTAAVPDVQWAFPRWSPDGTRIAASRWTHGGEYDVVVLDTAGVVRTRISADRALDTHPAWSPDGRWVVFSSDRSGIANLYAADVTDGAAAPRLRQITNVLTGAFHPDVSADGRWIHFSMYDAHGYHIARMPFDPAAWRDPAPVTIADPPSAVAAGRSNGDGADAFGEARPYSAWPSLLPTAWTPYFFGDDVVGNFVGAATYGRDLVGRWSWGASLAVDPADWRVQGGAVVAWAGLGNPVLSLDVFRDWEDFGSVRLPDQRRLPVLEREDDIGISATLLRRRWRSTGALSFGVGHSRRTRSVGGLPDTLRLTDPRDALIDFDVRVGYANYSVQPYSISREDGISVSFAAEHSIEPDPAPGRDASVTELTAWGATYKALHPWGFANHVFALRGSGLARLRDGATPSSIGGASGSILDAFGIPLGTGSRLLPVRGFDRGVRAGTRAWTATAEYRIPLALVGRRPAFLPLYIDRISALGFFDAGDAWCAGEAIQRFVACGLREDGTVADPPPLLSAGAELVFDVGFTSFLPALVRAGIAFPIQGPGDPVRLYAQLGASF